MGSPADPYAFATAVVLGVELGIVIWLLLGQPTFEVSFGAA